MERNRRAPRVPLRIAFGSSDLRRCQLAAAASRVADTAALVAVSIALFDRGGAGVVAVFGVVATLGPMLGTPLVTAAAGRLAPGRALATNLGGAAVLTAGTAVLIAVDGPTIAILATVGVGSALTASLRPLVTALLPTYIQRPEELVATNTAAAGVETLSTVLGPLVAGTLAALTGPAVALAAVTLVLGATALATWSLEGADPAAGPTTPGRVVGEMTNGLRTIVARGPIRLVTVLTGSQTFVRGALNVIVVSLAIERLRLGDVGVGLLLGAIGVGGFLGIPAAARATGGGRLGRTMALGLLLWGLPLVGVGLTASDPVVLVLLGIVGIGNTLLDIAADTLLQRFAPAGQLAPLLGAFEAALFATRAGGAAIAGILLQVTGPGTAMIAVGAILSLLAVAASRSLARLDETVRDRDVGVSLLRINGIFSPLVLSAVDQLSDAAAFATHAPGEAIVTEGEPGDRFYVIETGRAAVVRGGVKIDEIGPGDCFGEVALIDDRPRNASVVVEQPTTTRSLGRSAFLSALHSNHRSRRAAEELAEARRPRSSPAPDPSTSD